MPLYEYLCEACENQYEIMQSLTVKAEETVCPKCNATKSRRLMSAFASKVVGTHKTGFAEMKAYNMLDERASKFSKLPPLIGQRAMPIPPPGATTPGDSA
ncbi:MAG: hypothetical protein NPIRA05_01570 [Nitrospirales bacterium]|nr:MAG: hypothetical protein NPIRA05_01570 [Nitrospirales bacterium]